MIDRVNSLGSGKNVLNEVILLKKKFEQENTEITEWGQSKAPLPLLPPVTAANLLEIDDTRTAKHQATSRNDEN